MLASYLREEGGYHSGQAARNQPHSRSSYSGNEDDDYSRGCEDAKAGSYDRAHPAPAYERGWQSCNEKDEANDEAKAGKERQAKWDRGCADSKAGSYDRAHHNADYEAG